jgi:predicted TPR repeat methyltransferase
VWWRSHTPALGQILLRLLQDLTVVAIGTVGDPRRSGKRTASGAGDERVPLGQAPHEPLDGLQAGEVGSAILQQARPTKTTDVLDYGCGTGLVSLFLLPHVRSVTGADSSEGMLNVLRKKIGDNGIQNMNVMRLDLEHDRVPSHRYHLIVACMVLHHAANMEKVLAAFHGLLNPGGTLCIAGLDTEPGLFHDARAVASVHHHGFDRAELRSELQRVGFAQISDTTAHTIRKPVEGGAERGFTVFLITAKE